MERLVSETRQYIAAAAAYARAHAVGFNLTFFVPGQRILSNDLQHMPLAAVFRAGPTTQLTITVGRDPFPSSDDLNVDLNGTGSDLFFVIVVMPGETLYCTSALNPQGFLSNVMV